MRRLLICSALLIVSVLGSGPGTGVADRISAGTDQPTGGRSAPIVRDRPLTTELRALLSAAVSRANAPGGVLLVENGTSTWRGSVGFSQLRRSYGRSQVGARIRMPANARFRIGSVTKTFTATLVMQLVAAGFVSLDDTVERWLPGRLQDGAGAQITVRDLLQHRSGLQDAPLSFAGVFTVAGPPGRFYYANANYTLLGEIVAVATHSTYEAELQARILDPLGLTRTEVARSPITPTDLVHGYSPAPATPHGLRIDETSWTDSTPAPAGSMVSDAVDLARFERALFTGRVVTPDLVASMQTPISLDGFAAYGYTGYGLGLMRFPTRCGDAWGHRGRAPGYMAYMLSTADGTRVVVLLLNDGLLSDAVVAKLNPFVTRALCS